MKKLLSAVGVVGAAVAALATTIPAASARQVAIEYVPANFGVTRWIGVAGAPNGDVFEVQNHSSESAARNAANFACEQMAGRTCAAIVECLVVEVGPNRYSIPLSSVEECVELAPQPAFANGSDVLDLRGDLVPFLRLRELFDVPGAPPPYEKIVIVSTGQRRAGLVVDSLIGNNQTVIQPMSPLHRNVRSFLGATIMGDGEVVLVLDVIRMIDYGQSRQDRLRAS